jgi:hypothetical protein
MDLRPLLVSRETSLQRKEPSGLPKALIHEMCSKNKKIFASLGSLLKALLLATVFGNSLDYSKQGPAGQAETASAGCSVSAGVRVSVKKLRRVSR